MEKRNLGNTGTKVGALGIGAMSFSDFYGPTNTQESHAILKMALDNGIDHIDTAKVYIDQETVMTEYKNRFRSKIYDLNYDSLVTNPNEEIKSLISWLDWQWEDTYLSPHLNKRSVSTASNVEVRSPINSKSIGGWKNYKEMLKPSMEFITKYDKYRDLQY